MLNVLKAFSCLDTVIVLQISSIQAPRSKYACLWHNILFSSYIKFQTFMYPVFWCYHVLKSFSLPLWYSLVESLMERVELLAFSGVWLGLFVSVLLRLSARWQTGCQVHTTLYISRGRWTCHSYLLWFQSPHIPTHTLTHPVPAVTALKDPNSHIFLHNTPFYMKLCTSKKGG